MDKWILKQTVDLAKSPDAYSGSAALMFPGDAEAHVWQIAVMNNNAPVELDGASAMGYFARMDGNTVAIKGTVVGNIVRVTFKKECYAFPGALRGVVRLEQNGAIMTLCSGLFGVGDNIGDTIVDPGNAFPSLETLYKIVEGLEQRHDNEISNVYSNISALGNKVNANTASIAQIVSGATIDPNAEIADVRIGYDGTTYSSAGKAVRSQILEAIEMSDVDMLEHVTQGHIKRIYYDQNSTMDVYKLTDGEYAKSSTRPGSRYIKCPRYLLLSFSDDNARCYLYFYDLIDGEYTINKEIVQKTSSNTVINYLGNKSVGNLIEIPEGKYMVLGNDKGNVELYEWDGEPFGPSLSGDTTIVASNNVTGSMNENGTGGIVIPGSAIAVVCRNGGAISRVFGVKGTGEESRITIGNEAFVRFIKLPGGYDYYKARFSTDCTIYTTDKSTTIAKKTYTGNAEDYVSVACKSDVTGAAAGKAMRVLDIAKKINEIAWTPKKSIKVYTRTQTFKPGVEYNGVPYCSQWEKPRYVGWHVSLRTWLSALADENSVCYADNAIEPYYSLVCSAFAQLCCGWPYPATNVGMLYDPEVEMTRSHMPQLGAVWSDVYDNTLDGFHCVVPEMVEKIGDVMAISVYESTRPLSMRTTRYSNISSANSVNAAFNESDGADNYDSYGVAAYHKRAVAKTWKSPTPWFNLDDRTLVAGNVRPNKGDRSVYTSDETVTLNIKNNSATKVYWYKRDEKIPTVTVDKLKMNSIDVTGKTSIDVKEQLNKAGIYYIFTDLDDAAAIVESMTEARNNSLAAESEGKDPGWDAAWDSSIGNMCESFEYVVPEAITCTMTDNSIKFTRGGVNSNDFWYALVRLKGHPVHNAEKHKNATTISARADHDYSAYFKNGVQTASRTVHVFAKCIYGAYNVPVTVN